MNDKKKLGIFIIVLALILAIAGGTYAYWSWTTTSAQQTAITFTVASGFTCEAGGCYSGYTDNGIC